MINILLDKKRELERLINERLIENCTLIIKGNAVILDNKNSHTILNQKIKKLGLSELNIKLYCLHRKDSFISIRIENLKHINIKHTNVINLILNKFASELINIYFYSNTDIENLFLLSKQQ